MRIIFHLKRCFYDEIRTGKKTSEWRSLNDYWIKRLFSPGPVRAWFIAGYPKHNMPRLEAKVTAIIIHDVSKQIEIKFSNVKEIKNEEKKE